MAVFNLTMSVNAQINNSVEIEPGIRTVYDQHKQNVLKYSPLLANNTTVGIRDARFEMRDVRFAIRDAGYPVKDDYRVQTSPGFFCRQELKLQRFTTLNLFFRLGSLEHVNRLEGKNQSISRQPISQQPAACYLTEN